MNISKDELSKMIQTNKFIPNGYVLIGNKTNMENSVVVKLSNAKNLTPKVFKLGKRQSLYRIMEKKYAEDSINKKHLCFTFSDLDEVLNKVSFVGTDGDRFDSSLASLSLCYIIKFLCFYSGNDLTKRKIEEIEQSLFNTKETRWKDPVFLKINIPSLLDDLKNQNKYDFKICKIDYINDNIMKAYPIPCKTLGDLQDNISYFFDMFVDKKHISHKTEEEIRVLIKNKTIFEDPALIKNDIDFSIFKKERKVLIDTPNTKMKIIDPKG